jgi:hypothetical protein
MLKNKSQTENITPPPILVGPAKQGCATSFLTQKGGEMDKVCGPIQQDSRKEPREQYAQPDDEKKAGGEG